MFAMEKIYASATKDGMATRAIQVRMTMYVMVLINSHFNLED